MTHQTDPYADWDGAYVLGALSPDDRREYEQHLKTCELCSRAVGELAGIPGVLGLVEPLDALAVTGPAAQPSPPADDELAPPVSLLARRARTAQTRRRVLLVAAASALVLGGFATGTLVSQVSGEDQPPAVQALADEVRLQPVDGSGVQATLALQPAAWGTGLEWSCSYPEGRLVDGVTYELTLVSQTGERLTAATWTGGTTSTTTGLSASTALAPEEIARVELTTPASDVPLASVTL